MASSSFFNVQVSLTFNVRTRPGSGAALEWEIQLEVALEKKGRV
jgi:hypothetical protein